MLNIIEYTIKKNEKGKPHVLNLVLKKENAGYMTQRNKEAMIKMSHTSAASVLYPLVDLSFEEVFTRYRFARIQPFS